MGEDKKLLFNAIQQCIPSIADRIFFTSAKTFKFFTFLTSFHLNVTITVYFARSL